MVVLGTRRSGRTVVESPVPIDVIGEEEKRAVLDVLDSQSLFRYYGPDLLSIPAGHDPYSVATFVSIF